MTTTFTLDRLRVLLVDVQVAADDYLYTGTQEKRTVYDECLKGFDNEMGMLQKSYTDSIDLQTLKQVRTSFYDWITNIGDKKILLFSSGLSGEKLGQEIQTLGRQQSTTRYLETAKTLINSLYQRRLRSVPMNIEYAIELAKKINSYIIYVNVLLAVFSIVLGFFLTRSITKPVERLRDGTQNIMKGVFQPITLINAMSWEHWRMISIICHRCCNTTTTA